MQLHHGFRPNDQRAMGWVCTMRAHQNLFRPFESLGGLSNAKSIPDRRSAREAGDVIIGRIFGDQPQTEQLRGVDALDSPFCCECKQVIVRRN